MCLLCTEESGVTTNVQRRLYHLRCNYKGNARFRHSRTGKMRSCRTIMSNDSSNMHHALWKEFLAKDDELCGSDTLLFNTVNLGNCCNPGRGSHDMFRDLH